MIEYNSYRLWISKIDETYSDMVGFDMFNDGSRVWATVEDRDVGMWSIVGNYGWIR